MSGSTSGSSPSGGQFRIANGQIYDPSGNVFDAKGIAVQQSQLGDANQILSQFPGLNFVRLPVYSYQSPSAYASFIQTMTSHGVVVELEDHSNSTNANDGGSQGSAYTGQELSNELNWYSSIASAYASNPYVWFGTDNEPPNAGLSQWEQETYNTIRDTGNNNPIMMELPGGGYPSAQNISDYGMDPSVYASMSNIIADVHFYGWSSGGSTNQSTVDNTLSGLVQAAKTMPSANGTPPVIIGEYGISTYDSSEDSNGSQVLQAVQTSNQISGSSAWEYIDAGTNSLTYNGGGLTGYGQEVQQWIASGSQNGGSGGSGSQGSSSQGGNAPATPSAASTGEQSFNNTITFSNSNNWQNPLSGDTMFFINGSNNLIDLSGGSSTVTDNGGSNTFVLPGASTGSATFTNDVLALGDSINLQVALQGAGWDGNAGDIGNYLAVNDTASGATISASPSQGGAWSQVAYIPGETGLTLNGLLQHAVI